MFEVRRNRAVGHAVGGFTLIEMLTVIGIVMIVMALALPNFISMMRGRRWTAAVGNIQTLIWRARASATNVRKDFSVEFDIRGDNGTWMWLESEEQIIERVPDLDELQHQLGGGGAIYWIRSLFYYAGGTSKWPKHECVCRKCGHTWVQYTSPSACPACGASEWPYHPSYKTYYYDFEIVNDPSVHAYGDNARQSEVVELGNGMTIDDRSSVSPHFVNWDARNAVDCYGGDDYKDIRIGPNGALVQTQDPVLCIRQKDTDQSKQVRVVRCTGRLVPER